MTRKSRFARPSVVACLAVLILLIGLGAATARTIVDAAGRHVDVPDAVARVMAAGPPASITLYTLAPEKLVGLARAPSAAERPFIAVPYVDLPETGRLTGRGNTANFESVLALKPDVIVDIGTVNPTFASLADRVQAQTGIPYVLLDGSFAHMADMYRQLGEIVGEPQRAEQFAAYVERTLATLHDRLATIPAAERPRVYYGRGANGLTTGLAGSINLEVLDAVGAVNVAASAGSGGLTNVSLEQVLSWDPAIVLTHDENFYGAVSHDPAWQGVRALRDRRVYLAPIVPWGWFDEPPGPNRLIGVHWLTAILYPGRFPDDLRATAQEFYKMFYHVDVSAQQMDALLKDAIAPP